MAATTTAATAATQNADVAVAANNGPLFSFVITSMSEWRFDVLVRLLRSIRASNFSHHPVVVVDSGSGAIDHRMRSLAAEFAPNAPHVVLAEDVGLSGARNLGVQAATTPFVLVMDDDLVLDDKLTDIPLMLAAVTGSAAPAHIAGGSLIGSDPYSLRFMEERPGVWGLEYDGQQVGRRVAGTSTCIPVHMVVNFLMANRSSVVANPWPDGLKMFEHEAFFLRARLAALRVVQCDSQVARVRSADSPEYRSRSGRYRPVQRYGECFCDAVPAVRKFNTKDLRHYHSAAPSVDCVRRTSCMSGEGELRGKACTAWRPLRADLPSCDATSSCQCEWLYRDLRKKAKALETHGGAEQEQDGAQESLPPGGMPGKDRGVSVAGRRVVMAKADACVALHLAEGASAARAIPSANPDEKGVGWCHLQCCCEVVAANEHGRDRVECGGEFQCRRREEEQHKNVAAEGVGG